MNAQSTDVIKKTLTFEKDNDHHSFLLMRGLAVILQALHLSLLLLLQPHLNPLAKLLGQLPIALPAHWLCVPSGEVAIFEGTAARAALEMMLMIRLIQELLRSFKDGFLTDLTGVAE